MCSSCMTDTSKCLICKRSVNLIIVGNRRVQRSAKLVRLTLTRFLPKYTILRKKIHGAYLASCQSNANRGEVGLSRTVRTAGEHCVHPVRITGSLSNVKPFVEQNTTYLLSIRLHRFSFLTQCGVSKKVREPLTLSECSHFSCFNLFFFSPFTHSTFECTTASQISQPLYVSCCRNPDHL